MSRSPTHSFTCVIMMDNYNYTAADLSITGYKVPALSLSLRGTVLFYLIGEITGGSAS